MCSWEAGGVAEAEQTTQHGAIEPTASIRYSPFAAPAWFLIAIAAVFSYLFLLDIRWIRETAIPNTAVLGVATVALLYLASRRRSLVRLLFAGVSTAMLALLIYAMWFDRLPAPSSSVPVADAAERAPVIALPDSSGALVSTADFRGKGPVHIVFYRGYW